MKHEKVLGCLRISKVYAATCYLFNKSCRQKQGERRPLPTLYCNFIVVHAHRAQAAPPQPSPHGAHHDARSPPCSNTSPARFRWLPPCSPLAASRGRSVRQPVRLSVWLRVCLSGCPLASIMLCACRLVCGCLGRACSAVQHPVPLPGWWYSRLRHPLRRPGVSR